MSTQERAAKIGRVTVRQAYIASDENTEVSRNGEKVPGIWLRVHAYVDVNGYYVDYDLPYGANRSPQTDAEWRTLCQRVRDQVGAEPACN